MSIPLTRNYSPRADDLRTCAGCGQPCFGFPHAASLYCPPCALRLLSMDLDGFLQEATRALGRAHLVVEERHVMRRALARIAPTVLAAIEAATRRDLERRALC